MNIKHRIRKQFGRKRPSRKGSDVPVVRRNRRLLFDTLEDRRLLTATIDGLLDQGSVKLQDDDWESQVVDLGVQGRLDVGDVLLAVVEIQNSTQIVGTVNDLRNNSLSETGLATYSPTTTTITGISVVKVDNSTPLPGGLRQEYTFTGVTEAEWSSLTGISGVSDGTALILYDDPVSAPGGHIDFSTIANGIATATEGTFIAEFSVVGWRAISFDIGGDPTNPLAIQSLEFLAGLNTTTSMFTPVSVLSDPDVAPTSTAAAYFAALGATDLQLEGSLGSGPRGEFQLRTDTDLYINVISTPEPASLGDRLWEDTNGNGLQDMGEPGYVAQRLL